MNAIKVYDQLEYFNPASSKSFLQAHEMLMSGLIDSPGKFRTKGVGVVAGIK